MFETLGLPLVELRSNDAAEKLMLAKKLNVVIVMEEVYQHICSFSHSSQI